MNSLLLGGVRVPRADPAFPVLVSARPVGSLPSKAFPVLSSPQYQANAGSCLPHGFLAALESDAKARTGATVELNRLDCYFGARWLQGDETRDVGSYPGRAADWLLRYGTVLEDRKPYDPSIVTTWRPPADWAAERALLTADLQPLFRSIEQVKGELAAGRIVPVCHHTYEQMLMQAGKTGFESEPDPNPARTLGGHCRDIVGYDDATGMFLLWNWWKGWGKPHPLADTDSRFAAFRDSFTWAPYALVVHQGWSFDMRRIAKPLNVEV